MDTSASLAGESSSARPHPTPEPIRRRRATLAGHPVPAQLQALLSNVPGYGAPEVVQRLHWTTITGADVVVLHSHDPRRDLRALTDPAQVTPPILVVSTHPDPETAIDALRLGATSYLIDGEFTRGDLLGALIGTEHRQSSVSPAVTTALVRRCHARPHQPAAVHVPLTARDEDLLALLAQGCSNAAIGDRLFLAEKTVRNYISRLYTKLGVTNRPEAIVWWLTRAQL